MKLACVLLTTLLGLSQPASAGRCSAYLHDLLGNLARDFTQSYTTPALIENMPPLEWTLGSSGYRAGAHAARGKLSISYSEAALQIVVEPTTGSLPYSPEFAERMRARVPRLQITEDHEFDYILMMSTQRKTGGYRLLLRAKTTPEYVAQARILLEALLTE